MQHRSPDRPVSTCRTCGPGRALLALLALLAAPACATFTPSIDGFWARRPPAPRSSAAPALVLIGDIGMSRGADTERLARRVGAELQQAPGAPMLVLGDLFYVVGLTGECPSTPGVSWFGCDDAGTPDAQLEAVLGPYRRALPANPVIAIGGNHDFYGGEPAVRNTCDLVPRAGPGWGYYAKGCGLDAAHPVEVVEAGDVVVFAIDSEPMIRDRDYRKRTIEALRVEIARVRAERPDAWRLVATHHPLETHGSHNGATRVTGALKDLYWLRKTALLPLFYPLERVMGAQDPYELRYRAYRRALYRLFREQPIDAFVSGHDHSLQHVRIDHPGVGWQIISGAGAHRSPVKRLGLDFLWLNRLGRAVGLGGLLPAPRHDLEFGLGGEIDEPGLSGYGFAVLTPEADELVVDYVDPAHPVPVHTARIRRSASEPEDSRGDPHRPRQ